MRRSSPTTRTGRRERGRPDRAVPFEPAGVSSRSSCWPGSCSDIAKGGSCPASPDPGELGDGNGFRRWRLPSDVCRPQASHHHPALFLITLGVYSLILILPGNQPSPWPGHQSDTLRNCQDHGTAPPHEGFFAQYWNWLRAALQGNLGNSLFNNETVASGIAARFPVTLSVAVGGCSSPS